MRASSGKTIATMAKRVVSFAVLLGVSVALIPTAKAVPSYSRTYGQKCSACHNPWGGLTPPGLTFKLSGYRAMNGKDLKPVSPDIQVTKDFSLPNSLPLSIITGVGLESRTEKREANVGKAPSVTSKGTTLALEDLSIFLTGSMGTHFAYFIEFPMYETKAWEFTPTGNYEARYNTNPGGQVKFDTEIPSFEVAKFFWNNLFGEAAPRDSVNLLAGITHPPLAYSPGKVRLSVNQYLVYERTGLDLLSPRKVEDVVGGNPNDFIFRLSEPQVLAELFGMLTFGKPVTDVAKKDTFWAEYHLGISNGANGKAANSSTPSLYGRFVMRYYGQSFGLFGWQSSDSYSDKLRSASAVVNPNGIMSGKQDANQITRFGPDMTLSLAPWGIPVNLENQYMMNRESNPMGFGKEFKWKGGFHQLNYRPTNIQALYVRYDYVTGDKYDDTNVTVNAVGGITRSTPKETDLIFGYQRMLNEHVKFVFEYRHHQFDDTAVGPVIPTFGVATNPARLTDDGFTLKYMFGF